MKWFIGFVIFVVFVVLFIRAMPSQFREYYNAHDERDFPSYSTLKFEAIQMSSNMFVYESEKSEWGAGIFFVIGGAGGSSENQVEIDREYYGFVANKHGGTYFLDIPVDKCRLYFDAPEGKAFIVGNIQAHLINTYGDNCWSKYKFFNFHLPPDTIIPYIDKIDAKDLMPKTNS